MRIYQVMNAGMLPCWDAWMLGCYKARTLVSALFIFSRRPILYNTPLRGAQTNADICLADLAKQNHQIFSGKAQP